MAGNAIFDFYNSLNIGWRDILDIALVTVLFYNLISMVRQTRAVTAIHGIIVLTLVYFISGRMGLVTLNWLLGYTVTSMFMVVIIVFQRDIRLALASLGSRTWWMPAFFRKRKENPLVGIITEAALYMAARKIGALIVIERAMPLGDTTERGVRMDALASKELLINMFWPNSPLHDGAALLRGDRIEAGGCILPLSTAVAKRDYGTRHRAALGITEESDAVVVVVSEERGVVAIAAGGKLSGELDAQKLPHVLASAMEKTI